tara:strand:+ start:32522 stop:33073 length:552 start_codon:yes stop_codon:yes gene_type:complete
MALQLTQAQIDQIDTSWKEFEASYEFEKKFGVEALEQKLNAERKGQGLTNVDQKFVLSVIGELETDGIKNIDDHFRENLSAAHGYRKKELSARVDMSLPNENVPTNENTNQARITPSWAKDMDIAAATVSAARKTIAESNEPAEFMPAYKTAVNALKNQLKNDYKMRMAMRATPKRGVDTPKI